MKLKILSKWPSMLIVSILIITTALIVYTYSYSKNSNSIPRTDFSKKIELVIPSRIVIPKINVNAAIESVGLTTKGEVGVTEGPSNAAWFNASPTPGEIGNSVIDGHSGWKDGTPAVFDDLHNLTEGDKIYVENQKGDTITFIVRSLQIYGKNENTSSIFISNDGIAHLILITCSGPWNKYKKSSYDRLVVFSDKE